MLNENGVIIDDGTVARLGRSRFLVTTTSGGASRIANWLEEWRQCEWPDLNVFVSPVTTQWATIAVAGPRARELLGRFESDLAIDAKSLPHMSLAEGRFAGAPARLYRVSFSGELGYEINVPARYGAALWRELLSAGADLGVTPYGVETALLLRLEKGFLHVGVDTDGTDHSGRRRLGRDRGAQESRFHRQAVAAPSGQSACRPAAARRAYVRRRDACSCPARIFVCPERPRAATDG